VRHHIASIIEDKRNTVLMVGYCGPASLGGELIAGAKTIEILSDSKNVEAEVDLLPGMSAHGDQDDLMQFLNVQDPLSVKGIFLVHGEYAVQKSFCDRLELKGFKKVEIPAHHEHYELQAQNGRERKAVAA
jgi:metallo-beta-lactamase family protein